MAESRFLELLLWSWFMPKSNCLHPGGCLPSLLLREPPGGDPCHHRTHDDDEHNAGATVLFGRGWRLVIISHEVLEVPHFFDDGVPRPNAGKDHDEFWCSSHTSRLLSGGRAARGATARTARPGRSRPRR